MDATHPHGVGPVVARSTTHRRAISAVVARATLVVARPRSIVARSQPFAPERDSSSLNPTAVVARPCTRRRLLHTRRRPNFFNLRTRCHSNFYFRTHRCLVEPVVASSLPVLARCILVIARCTTRRRDPSRTLPALALHPSAPAL